MQLRQAARAHDPQGPLAAAQPVGLHQAGQAEVVVGVQVGDQHEIEVQQAEARAQQLALGALAAVERASARRRGPRAWPRCRGRRSAPTRPCRSS